MSIPVLWQENTSQLINEKKLSATVMCNISLFVFNMSFLTAFPSFINLYMVVNFRHLSSNELSDFIVGYRSVSETLTIGKDCDRISKLFLILTCYLLAFSASYFSDAISMLYLLIF